MIVTRFAPSPTGTAASWAMPTAPRSAMRGRRRAAASFGCGSKTSTRRGAGRNSSRASIEDLRWLGIDWDEPRADPVAANGGVSGRARRAKARGLAIACFCTRADIAQSLTAPHGDAATSYPGTCRALPDDPERRATTPHCWRLNSAKALEMTGLPAGPRPTAKNFEAKSSDIGDAILARKDAPASYHLSCVVDDAESGVTWSCAARTCALRRRSSACCSNCSAFPNRPTSIIRSSPMRTAAVSPSATSRRRSPRCAKPGSTGHSSPTDLLEGKLPLGFAFRTPKSAAMTSLLIILLVARHGGDRLCSRPRRDRHGLGQGRDR